MSDIFLFIVSLRVLGTDYGSSWVRELTWALLPSGELFPPAAAPADPHGNQKMTPKKTCFYIVIYTFLKMTPTKTCFYILIYTFFENDHNNNICLHSYFHVSNTFYLEFLKIPKHWIVWYDSILFLRFVRRFFWKIFWKYTILGVVLDACLESFL